MVWVIPQPTKDGQPHQERAKLEPREILFFNRLISFFSSPSPSQKNFLKLSCTPQKQNLSIDAKTLSYGKLPHVCTAVDIFFFRPFLFFPFFFFFFPYNTLIVAKKKKKKGRGKEFELFR